MSKIMLKVSTSLLLAGGVLAGCGQSNDEASGANEKCVNLKGSTITMVVPYAPGGGFDTYARAFAPELGKKLDATVVVENEDGAGGLLAMNNLYSRAKKDGTDLAIMNGTGTLQSYLAKQEGVNFDPTKFTYVGRLSTEPNVMVAGPKGDIKSVDDMQSAKALKLGSTGPGSNDYLQASVMRALLSDSKVEIVSGYDGSTAADLAVTNGEVDAYISDVTGRLPGIRGGDLIPLMVVSTERDEQLPDVPTILELKDLTDDQKSIVEADLKLREASRLIVGPPNMCKANVEVLRTAFEALVTDEKVLNTFKEAKRPMMPLPGADVQALVEEIVSKSPAAFVDMLKLD